MSDEPEVLVARRGALGMLTLNRPKAINALTHKMVRIVSSALDDWERDTTVRTIVVTGAGERGLCAGGDIVALYRDAKEGDGRASGEFWADEYRMNARLASYPKPVVAIQDGIVLGGGIGISAHCSHRIVTERSKLGLPEVGIGFVPDVGATWLLSRSPGETGTAVALSARSVAAGDAIALGLSDTYMPSERIERLLAALEVEDPVAAIALLAEEAPTGELADARGWIDEAFAGDDIAVIVGRLGDIGEPGASFLRGIERASPVAAAVTLASLRRTAALDSLEQALAQEYRVSMHALRTHDFVEGVRAQVIDKDRSPSWSPARFDLVTADEVTSYFEVPPGGDLDLTSKEKR
jgi:enoyl-CoA hydratase